MKVRRVKKTKKVDDHTDIDEEWLYYVYSTVLKRSEEEFMTSTPAKIIKQIDIHTKFVNNSESDNDNNKPKHKEGVITSAGFTVTNRR